MLLNELALAVGGGLQQFPDQACSRGGPERLRQSVHNGGCTGAQQPVVLAASAASAGCPHPRRCHSGSEFPSWPLLHTPTWRLALDVLHAAMPSPPKAGLQAAAA